MIYDVEYFTGNTEYVQVIGISQARIKQCNGQTVTRFGPLDKNLIQSIPDELKEKRM